jgi:multidrug efflux pump
LNIAAPFIARPVATTLLALAVLLAGALGYRALPVSSLPQVDFPTIQVTTQLPGADARTMAVLITAPLERQLGQISGLETMTSTSGFGTSAITLQFALGRNIDDAAQDVQSAINVAGGTLPRNLPYPPTYAKVNPADPPILSLALTSRTLPIPRVSDAADSVLAQKLAQVAGVGRVRVQGGQKPAIRIRFDAMRLSSYGIGLEEARTVLARANANQSKGSFDGPSQAFTITANDQIADAAGYREVILAFRNGAPVRLADVAEVGEGLENERVASWSDGRPAVVLDVLRQPGANIVATAEAIKASLPAFERALPAGIELRVVADRTQTIRASVREVQHTLIIATALVVGVILVFLRSWRATLIPAVALPLSLVATFGVMALAGYSLDNLSLMALTIATGFVVDDAIVMIENVARHVEQGKSPMEAAYVGAREIGFTIVSLTVSLVAVFIPLLFMGGVVGRLFREFSVTLSVAVVVSAIVSLTLTPMMCARMLKPEAEQKHGPLARGAERMFDGLVAIYMRTLDRVLARPALTLLVAVLSVVATVALYAWMPKGFLPPQDTGQIVAVVEGDQDSSFGRMSDLQARAVTIVRADPDVAAVTSFVGVGAADLAPNAARLSITLVPRDDRAGTASAIAARLADALAVLPAAVVLQPVPDIQVGTRAARTLYQYTLTAADGAELGRWASTLVERLRASAILRDVGTDQQPGGRQVRLTIDRTAAARLGVSMQAIDDTLYSAFGQRQISTIYAQMNQYRVVMEVAPEQQADPSMIGLLRVSGAGGAQVPLAAVARLEAGPTALTVTHQGQFPAVTVSFDLRPGASLGEAVDEIARVEAEIGMPPTVTGRYAGDAAEFQRALAGQPWLILAAIVVIYIVLGVLYESLIHPITILSTLPSAGIGALLSLWFLGHDLSIVGLIGIVLLMGIVKKNAIMMIDFALEAERTQGMAPFDAIREACRLRFRPILMTTMAALLGAIPLAVGTGTGAELRQPLGVAIVGGLVLSQLLTLYTTPVIYLWFDRIGRRLSGTPVPAAAEPVPFRRAAE